MKRGAYVERYADIIALITKAPRTIAELSSLAGISDMPTRRFVNALKAEGLVTSQYAPRVEGSRAQPPHAEHRTRIMASDRS